MLPSEQETPRLELICYEVEPGRVDLVPATTSRSWMDETPGGHVYRCLPVTMANSHGWEILCPVDLEMHWDGGHGVEAIQIRSQAPAANPTGAYLAYLLGEGAASQGTSDKGSNGRERMPAGFVESHFGSGIVTFNPLVVLRTPPGYNLWLAGPVNHFKDGIQAISAVVEADWMPFTFSLNWKFTRPDVTVSFAAGEPLCSFFPVPRGVVDTVAPLKRALHDDPEVAKAYWSARTERNLSTMAAADDRERFQGWYARGQVPGSDEKPRGETPRPSRPRPFAMPTSKKDP